MPNIKSAKKRVLVNATKAARNKATNSALKTAIKKANAAIESGDANKAEAVKVAVKKLDQAAAKGLLHKNNAAHKKSQLLIELNEMKKNPRNNVLRGFLFAFYFDVYTIKPVLLYREQGVLFSPNQDMGQLLIYHKRRLLFFGHHLQYSFQS